MAKIQWKPGNMVYPLPAVMVSCADKAGNSNIITIAWTGTVCTNPPMAYISVRPERHSYQMIRETGEFVINLTTLLNNNIPHNPATAPTHMPRSISCGK